MTLSAGVISASELNTECTANTSALATNAAAGAKEWQIDVEAVGVDLSSATTLRSRMVEFTPPDDCELRVLGFSGYGHASDDVNVILTLTCVDPTAADTDSGLVLTYPLLDKAVRVTATVQGGATTETNATRTDFRTASGDRHMLRAGNTYRLTFSSTGSGSASPPTRVFGFVLLRALRRRR